MKNFTEPAVPTKHTLSWASGYPFSQNNKRYTGAPKPSHGWSTTIPST